MAEKKPPRDLEVYKVPYYVEKYRTIRHQSEGLFESERYFLPRCLRPQMRVLDIGCACGGFFNILRSFEPTLEYRGVDISEVLVAEARRLYPEGHFEVVDATTLPYPDGSFDLVQAWGVTLHEPNYRKLIREAWRVTDDILLFDVRLQQSGQEVIDKMRSFVLNPGGVRNYYIVPNGLEFLQWLLDLHPTPGRIEFRGYQGEANKYATLPREVSPLYITSVGLFRREDSGKNKTLVELKLPAVFRNQLQKVL